MYVTLTGPNCCILVPKNDYFPVKSVHNVRSLKNFRQQMF